MTKLLMNTQPSRTSHRLAKTLLALIQSPWVPRALGQRVWWRVAARCVGARFERELVVDGRRFRVPIVVGLNDQLIIEEMQAYDQEVFILIRRLFANSRPVILDVGGNRGQYVLRLKASWPMAEIHTFEPFPQLAALLRELATVNQWGGLFVNQCLLGHAPGTGHLFFDGTETTTASTVAGFQSNHRHSIEVERTTLDDYVRQAGLNRIDLLKIDVEGGELEVIEGAAQMLTQLRPLVLMELLWTQNLEHLTRQRRVIALLRDAGYNFHLIKMDGTLEYQAVPQPDPHYRLLNFLISPTPSAATASCASAA